MRETALSPNPPDAAWANPPLDRTSPLPLYAQIKQRLIGLILRWEQPNRRFYSDEQLCAVFCVSRETVRQALAELVQEGQLRRGRGVGTFVSMRKLEERFGPGMDFLRQWETSGVPMQSTLLAFERRPAGDTIGVALGLDANAIVLFIKRVRAAARVPVRSITGTFLTTSWSIGMKHPPAGRRSTSFGKGSSFAKVTSRSKRAPPGPKKSNICTSTPTRRC